RPDAFLANVRAATEFEVKRRLSQLGQPVDRAEWRMTPPTVNAYFDPTANNINFPAGILQPPFFDFSLDDAVNYGGMGRSSATRSRTASTTRAATTTPTATSRTGGRPRTPPSSRRARRKSRSSSQATSRCPE